MSFEDPEMAAHQLARINYYRLAAYWLPFQIDRKNHIFEPGTSFEKVLGLYEFDRELRLIVLDAIERIEVAIRARWAYELSHAYGPHAHLNKEIALRSHYYWRNVRDLEDAVARSDELFIAHMRTKYREDLPPLWAVCEVMSLGLLSRWYANLKPQKVRTRIARPFGLSGQQLESWLHHLVIVRNVSAHHARLWNREFTIVPSEPRKRPSRVALKWNPDSRRLYNTLLILLHLMDAVVPGNAWRERLQAHLGKLQHQPTSQMGFPEDLSPLEL